MSIQKVVVDTESYQWVPGGSLTVQGWKAVEGESAAILVLDEKGEPVESKPLVYKAKKQTPATAHQVRQLKELMAEYGIADVISWDNLTRSQASRLYDEYRSTYINRCVDGSE